MEWRKLIGILSRGYHGIFVCGKNVINKFFRVYNKRVKKGAFKKRKIDVRVAFALIITAIELGAV